MTYPNISEFYWKAICNQHAITSIHVNDYYVKDPYRECFGLHIPRESDIYTSHNGEIFKKNEKGNVHFLTEFVKKWTTIPLQKQHTHTNWDENIFCLWVNFEKKNNFWLGQMVLFESISLVFY